MYNNGAYLELGHRMTTIAVLTQLIVQGPHDNLCMLSTEGFFYLLFNTNFVGSTNTIKKYKV